jgi:WD40 repeat protein
MKRNPSTGLHRLFCVCSLLFLGLAEVPMIWAQDPPGRPNNSNDAPPKMGLIRDVGISADGKLAFAGDANRVIWIWDVPKRKLVRAIQDRSQNRNTFPCFAFSSDGKFALVGNAHGGGFLNSILDRETLTFWDLSSGIKLRAFECQGESVYGVALSPDGKRALSVSLCKTILPEGIHPSVVRWHQISSVDALRLWDTSNGTVVRSLFDENAECANSEACFSADGRFFAGAASPVKLPPRTRRNVNAEYPLKIWAIDAGRFKPSAEFLCAGYRSITFSPDSKHIAIGHGSNISLWNLATGKRLWNHDSCAGSTVGRWPVGSAASVAFSPDGKRLVAAGPGTRGILGVSRDRIGGMTMLDVATGERVRGFVGTKEWVGSVSFTPDGKMLIGACVEGLRFWDSQTGEPFFTLSN